MLVMTMRLQKGQPNKALVPLVETLRELPLPCLSHLRSDATFLTHLLVAAADTLTQRASSGEADAAYHATGKSAAAARITVRV
jgi:hypothetical protein